MNKVGACLHNYQPPRRLRDVIYQPIQNLKESLNGQLIPQINGKAVHNWNQQILEECYAPCAIEGVYKRINFNFGPTLLQWLEENDESILKKIIQSDKESQIKFQGQSKHGNAIAQASYNHIILPLAKSQDKQTQVKWGINTFEKYFDRAPEGMWLPETAVDLETLSILSKNGIKFVVLSPNQADKVRPINSDHEWTSVRGGRIDPAQAYRLKTSDNNEINIFFFDKNISYDVAFSINGIFNSHENFIRRLQDAQGYPSNHEKLIHFATDGETFGHHHKHSLGPLTTSLDILDSKAKDWYGLELCNYSLFLEKNPPRYEVQIIENTAWSCEHNLGRWGQKERTDCNCGPVWDSKWRYQLREAFDYLKQEVDKAFTEIGSHFLKNPLEAKDDYTAVVNNIKPLGDFLDTHVHSKLSSNNINTIHRLLEMQKFSELMYTSCAWFHDDIRRTEPFTSLLCAKTTIELLKELAPNKKIEEEFINMLERIQFGNKEALHVYNKATEIVKSYK